MKRGRAPWWGWAEVDIAGSSGGEGHRSEGRRCRDITADRHHRYAARPVRGEHFRDVQVRSDANPGRCVILVDVGEQEEHEKRSTGGMNVHPVTDSARSERTDIG
jgi:hypothetical protein